MVSLYLRCIGPFNKPALVVLDVPIIRTCLFLRHTKLLFDAILSSNSRKTISFIFIKDRIKTYENHKTSEVTVQITIAG